MEEIKFNSLQELYNRLLPALRSKVKELERHNVKFIKEEDVWNALKDKKWVNCKVLNLSDMVNDILNTDNAYFVDYVSSKIKKQKVDANLDGEGLL